MILYRKSHLYLSPPKKIDLKVEKICDLLSKMLSSNLESFDEKPPESLDGSEQLLQRELAGVFTEIECQGSFLLVDL